MPSGRGSLGLPLGPSSTGASSGVDFSAVLRFASARGFSSGFSGVCLSPLPLAEGFASGAGDPSALPEELRSSSAAAATMASCARRFRVRDENVRDESRESRIGKGRSRARRDASTKKKIRRQGGGRGLTSAMRVAGTGSRALGTRRS